MTPMTTTPIRRGMARTARPCRGFGESLAMTFLRGTTWRGVIYGAGGARQPSISRRPRRTMRAEIFRTRPNRCRVVEPRTPWRLPWGPLLTVAGLALVVFVLFRGRPGMWSPAPWPVLAAVTLAVAMSFLVLRRLVSPTWGVVGGLLLAAHRYSWNWVPPFDQTLWAQALELS